MNFRKLGFAMMLTTFMLVGCSSESNTTESQTEATTAEVTTTAVVETTESTTANELNEGKVDINEFTRGVDLATVNIDGKAVVIRSGSRLSDIIKDTGLDYTIYENAVDELYKKTFDFYRTISLNNNSTVATSEDSADETVPATMDIFLDIVDSEGKRVTKPNPANFTQYYVAGVAFTGWKDPVRDMTSYGGIKLYMSRDEINSCLGVMSSKSTICTTANMLVYVDYSYNDEASIIYAMPIELGRDTTTTHDADDNVTTSSTDESSAIEMQPMPAING